MGGARQSNWRLSISCAPEGGEASARVDELRDLGARALVAWDAEPLRARFRFRTEDGCAEAVEAFARTEKQCCPFFEFTLTRTAGELTVEINAPEEGARLLAKLVDALTASRR